MLVTLIIRAHSKQKRPVEICPNGPFNTWAKNLSMSLRCLKISPQLGEEACHTIHAILPEKCLNDGPQR